MYANKALVYCQSSSNIIVQEPSFNHGKYKLQDYLDGGNKVQPETWSNWINNLIVSTIKIHAEWTKGRYITW